MVTSLNKGKLKKLRVRVEDFKMSEAKNNFFGVSGIDFIRKRKKRKFERKKCSLN